MDLIKTVRGLDENGPGEDGENLKVLYSQLSACADSQFHAAEESALRWLLKLMNGSTPSAETMRRFPLCWTILDCIFSRMPLFSLAKTLAFRKFIAVLQQSVTDLAKVHGTETLAKPGKRKRNSTPKYELQNLKSTESRVQCAQSLFNALRSLLGRLDDKTHANSHDKIGAEHIRSLLSLPVTETIEILRPLFTMCSQAFESGAAGELDGAEEWVSIINLLWEYHLKGDGDAAEVAQHLHHNTLLLVDRLEGLGSGGTQESPLTRRWSSDLQLFLQKAVIQQAKAAYISQRSQDILTIAINTTKANLGPIVLALYHVVSSAPITSEIRRRKGEIEWMENTFEVIEEAIRDVDGRETILKSLLQRATAKSMPIKADHLRLICREYALDRPTQWDILALVVKCDPDVFQVTEEGKRLLEIVCGKILAETDISASDFNSMTDVVDGIFDGFRISRDLPGSLRLWYEQMCLAEGSATGLQSPWFQAGQSRSDKGLSVSIESQMTASQLSDVLDWLVTAGIQSDSLSVFLAGITQGIRSTAFADAVSGKIFELSQLIKRSKSWAVALRWRAISWSIAWLSPDKRYEAWLTIAEPLGKAMRKSQLESADCYEAFKCCCQVWSSMRPDDASIQEPFALLEKLSERLTAHIADRGLPTSTLSQDPWTTIDYDLRKGPEVRHYIAWYSRGSSRLAHLTVGKVPSAPALSFAAEALTHDPVSGQSAWEALVGNDQVWQNNVTTPEMITRLITVLKNSAEKDTHVFPSNQRWLQLLSSVPSEAFTRQQREETVAILVAQARAADAGNSLAADLDDWRFYLALIQKLVAKPTFYDGLRFEDLTIIFDMLSTCLVQLKSEDEVFLEMIQRTTDITTAMLKQVTENIDERALKYLGDSAFLSSTTEEDISGLKDACNNTTAMPLRLTLMKCLASQLSQASVSHSRPDLENLCTATRDSLSKLITALVNRWVNDKSSREKHAIIFGLYAALDASHSLRADMDLTLLKSSKLQKLDRSSYETMAGGDLRGWTIQIFLRSYLPGHVEQPLPATLPRLDNIPTRLRESTMARMMDAVTKSLDLEQRVEYVSVLINNINAGEEGQHSQIMAIDKVVRQMIEVEQSSRQGDRTIFSILYGRLIQCMPSITNQSDASRLCRVVQVLLETSPQPLGQWNIELTLESLCDLASQPGPGAALPYTGLCKLVETVIKKHRLRLEGHYHLLTTLLQALLSKLITSSNAIESKGSKAQAALAHAYGRILTLICEPTTGAVSRAQQTGSLSSATDTAKRSAGKHMYLILMQYVKLQLEGGVARPVREALEPAMNSIFDITSSEGRKILNDSMNASGRAILREMFKRYTKFGKWSGV
ncbi:urb2/Npa2 family protein [Sarocladium implicatum]|nr:urb2/Npa2 family protein [Sarocladium implicatum]